MMVPMETDEQMNTIFKEADLRALRRLKSDNAAARHRVAMMLDAIAVAKDFTRERQAQKMQEAVATIDFNNAHQKVVDSFNLLPPLAGKLAADGLQKTMRAASVILTHSYIDDMLNSVLSLLLWLRRNDWIDDVYSSSRKTYTLKDLKATTIDVIVSEAVIQFFNSQKHLSVCNRNDTMLRHLGKHKALDGLTFIDRDTLKGFDKKRHELVHGRSILNSPGDDLGEVAETECVQMFDHGINILMAMARLLDVKWDSVTEFELGE
jgi:hypothetical protein